MSETMWHLATREVLSELAAFAGGLERHDVVAATDQLAASLLTDAVTVAVVGGYQSGKTELIGSMLGVVLATAANRPLVVTHGPVIRVSDTSRGVECEADQLGAAISAFALAGTGPVTVELPSPLLEGGLVLVDTPGSPGFGGDSVVAALSLLPITDAVVVVSPATQPLAANELGLASGLARAGRPMLVAVTKADLQVDVDAMIDIDRAALDAVGCDAEVLGVSCLLRRVATDVESDEINDESGMEPVVDWLLDQVVHGAAAHRQRRVVVEAQMAIASLRDPIEMQLKTIDAPLRSERVEALERRYRELSTSASRWNQTLIDEMAELRTSADADIRQRARDLIEQAGAKIDTIDPADEWDVLARWLEAVTADAMAEHLQWRDERLRRSLESTIGDVIELLDGVSLSPGPGPGPADGLPVLNGEPVRVSLRTSLHSSLRNSYSGVLMLGFLGGVAGIVLTAPLTVGIGLALGGKNFRQERAKQLGQRRAAAKAAVRTYADAAWAPFGADARAQLAKIQRQLRADLSAYVDRALAETKASFEAARAILADDADDRPRRRGHAVGQLEQLDVLAERFEVLGDPRVLGLGA